MAWKMCDELGDGPGHQKPDANRTSRAVQITSQEENGTRVSRTENREKWVEYSEHLGKTDIKKDSPNVNKWGDRLTADEMQIICFQNDLNIFKILRRPRMNSIYKIGNRL